MTSRFLPIFRGFSMLGLTLLTLCYNILAHFTKLSKRIYKENLNFFIFNQNILKNAIIVL